MLKITINSTDVKEAFYNKDRNKLVELLQDRWNVLKDENKYLDVLHFHLPDGTSFVRMHKLNKFGDNISEKRAMAAAIHSLKKPLYGFEAGVFSIAYRTFLPIFYKKIYIGAVEFGSKPEEIFDQMDYYHGLKGVLFVKNNDITKKKIISSLKVDDFKLTYNTLINKSLILHLPKDYHLDKDTTITFNDKHYALYVFDFKDYKNNVIAKALFFNDITDIKTQFEHTILKIISLLIILLSIVMMVINFGFKKIIGKLDVAHKQLKENHIFTSSILDNSAHFVIATDELGVITLFNKKAEEILGYSSSEIVDQETPLIFHKKEEIEISAKKISEELDIDVKDGFQTLVIKTDKEFENSGEWTYVGKNNLEFKVFIHITSLKSPNGDIIGYLFMGEDITLKKFLENSIKKQKDELETIFNTAKDGIAILDFETNFLFFNKAYLEMTGFEYEELQSKKCLHLLSPDEVEKSRESLLEVRSKGYLENLEKTCIVKDNKKIIVSMSIALMPDNKRLLITVKDITELKIKEKKITDYVKLIDKNIIASSTDLSGKITYVSEAFCEISGFSKEELIGKSHSVVKHPDMNEDIYKDLWKTLSQNKTWKGELKNIKKDHGCYWVIATISPIFDENGSKIGYTAIRQDITDKKKIEEISITDGLTNIYNRRHFNALFPKIINSAKRKNELLSFIILDIDHFKQYNDTYGHQMGDDVLIKVSKAMKDSLHRSDDYCFRLGGEEFGIIFKSDNKDKAVMFSNTIRENIENLNIEHTGNSASKYVTVSMGLICKNAKDINDYNEIYKESDELLYEAKESGRNKVCFNC